MNTVSKTITQGMLIIVMMFSFTGVVYSFDEPYAVLAPLPGIGDTNGTTTFSTYLSEILNLAIGIAAVMAFVMITFGGITYATSDAVSGKSQGKEYITNAIWGLLLVIGAWVILYTINPNILNFNLNPGTPSGSTAQAPLYTPISCCNRTGGVLDGYTLSPAEVDLNTAIVEMLHNNGVEVKNGPCTTGGTIGCTNVYGLPGQVITNLLSLKSACNACLVVITGGTEGGHSTHGPNMSAVDLSPTSSLNTYLGTINPKAQNPTSGTTVNLPGGGVAKYENTGDNGRASAPHWHVQY